MDWGEDEECVELEADSYMAPGSRERLGLVVRSLRVNRTEPAVKP